MLISTVISSISFDQIIALSHCQNVSRDWPVADTRNSNVVRRRAPYLGWTYVMGGVVTCVSQNSNQSRVRLQVIGFICVWHCHAFRHSTLIFTCQSAVKTRMNAYIDASFYVSSWDARELSFVDQIYIFYDTISRWSKKHEACKRATDSIQCNSNRRWFHLIAASERN